MGLKQFLGMKGSKGIQCEKNSDNSQTCTRFEIQGNQRISTGSSLTFSVDPQTCSAGVSGDVTSILDEEMNKKINGSRLSTRTCVKT